MRGGEASRVDGDVADAGGPLCDAQLAGTRGHVTAILAAHVRDAGAEPRLRRPRAPCFVASTVSASPCITVGSPEPNCATVAAPMFSPSHSSVVGSRAEYGRKGGERKGRYLLFRWVCTPTAHRRTPRLRGIRVPQGLVFDPQWFIPARAGKTERSTFSPSVEWAHPRAGGENYWPTGGQDHATGSSPRGRGKPRGQHTQPVRVRLIPARAGKTVRSPSRSDTESAHPRAGGENLR